MTEAFTNITPSGVMALFVVCGFIYLVLLSGLRSLTIIFRGYPPGPFNNLTEYEDGPLSDPDDDEDDDEDEGGPECRFSRTKPKDTERNNMPTPGDTEPATSRASGHWTDDEAEVKKTIVLHS